ncbi:MAG: ATP synthase F1 subunit delta [candidate division NC10 bacterium]|nr:ATP synthase F1 subunit delta [candidate division NC10 bacterium]
MSRALSTRYARAIADLAVEAGRLEEVGNQLDEFSRLLEENPPFRALFLPRPDLDRERQRSLLAPLLEALQMEGLVRSFLLFLLGQGNFSLLPKICLRYRELADARMQRARVILFVPTPLGEEELQILRQAFRRRIGKEVVMEQREDPSLLGGWRAEVGSSELWDASIRGELERFRTRLARSEAAL